MRCVNITTADNCWAYHMAQPARSLLQVCKAWPISRWTWPFTQGPCCKIARLVTDAYKGPVACQREPSTVQCRGGLALKTPQRAKRHQLHVLLRRVAVCQPKAQSTSIHHRTREAWQQLQCTALCTHNAPVETKPCCKFFSSMIYHPVRCQRAAGHTACFHDPDSIEPT